MKKKHTVALIWTQYTLMLYMLAADDWKKTKLFLYQSRIGKELIQRINEVGGCFWGGYRLTAFACNTSKNIFVRISKRILYVIIENFISCWIYWIGAKNIKCYGYESIFCNTKFLDAGCSFSVLEDGVSTYMEHAEAERFWKKNQMPTVSPKYLPGGWSDAVENIFITGRKKIPLGLEEKIQMIDLVDLWSRCSEEKKKEILYIFQFDLDRWVNLIENGRDIVLLTTNPNVDGMTLEKWQLLYKEIMSHYDSKKVIIKPHPIDPIEYERLFPGCPVIRNVFPFEICRFIQLPIKKVVGVKSTALYGIWPEDMVDDYTDEFYRINRC